MHSNESHCNQVRQRASNLSLELFKELELTEGRCKHSQRSHTYGNEKMLEMESFVAGKKTTKEKMLCSTFQKILHAHQGRKRKSTKHFNKTSQWPGNCVSRRICPATLRGCRCGFLLSPFPLFQFLQKQ